MRLHKHTDTHIRFRHTDTQHTHTHMHTQTHILKPLHVPQEEIRSVPRVFSVLCLALEPPIADDSALAALVPRIQLAALRLLVDVTKASR